MRELLLLGRIGASANCSRRADSGVGEKLGSTVAKSGLSEAIPGAPPAPRSWESCYLLGGLLLPLLRQAPPLPGVRFTVFKGWL